MPLFWLRVALIFYGVGLVYALVSLWGSRSLLSRIVLPAVAMGGLFHFVSLIENAMLRGNWTPSSMHELESLLAFLLIVFFFIIYARYRAMAPGLAVFPLVFLLTASAGFKATPTEPPLPLFVSAEWIYIHVALILVGYTALLFSFIASILYLIQERSLKSKSIGGFWSRLPSLATIDDIGYQCLVWGFPFMTLGLIAGAVMAEARVGSQYFLDLKILAAFVTWVLYAILLYMRGNAGWRGRKAAYLASFAFATALLAWAANNLSHTHRFIAP